MEYKLLFKWFDFWIGFFWDKEAHWLYIFPIPTLGIVLKFQPRKWVRPLTKDKNGYIDAWQDYKVAKRLYNKHYK